MFSELLFVGNPIVDTICAYDRPLIDRVFGATPEPGHYPIEKLLSLESMLPRVHFKGASGGAFTAAATAAGLSAGVSYYGSCGQDFGLFKSIAERQGFSIIDPVGDKTSPTGRCLLFLNDDGVAAAGPFVNRGAASLFGSDMMPPASRTCLPFIEGYLMSNWRQLPEFQSEYCAVDLSSVFIVSRIGSLLDQLKHNKKLIVFANQAEAEMFLDAELGQASSPDPVFHQRAVEFCNGGHVLIVKAAHNGALVYSTERTGSEVPWVPAVYLPKEMVLDSSSAGDCFAGAFLGGLLRGYDLKTAAVHATKAGADCVMRYGNGYT